jgi:hypothetical protein
MKRTLKFVSPLYIFLWIANSGLFALAHYHCPYKDVGGVNERRQLNNILSQEKSYSSIHPSTSDKERKGKKSQSPRVQLEEDELNSLKPKGNNSLIILALIIVEYLNYYFKNSTPQFHFYNSDLGRQYLVFHVLRI